MLKNIIITVALVASLTSLGLIAYQSKSKHQLVYIDNALLYKNFDYSKQALKELEQIITIRRNITDSLYEAVRKKAQEFNYSKNKNADAMQELERMREEYLYKKEQFEKESQTIVTASDTKIWTQINEYVAQYGKESGSLIVFGANGQGNIMYGDDLLDKTKEVIEYVNKKYNDKK
jgi:outer membrane protein